MDTLVALITEKFHDSVWTNQEVGYALGRDVPIISLKLENKGPCGFIGKFQALFCSWDSASMEIVKILLKHDKMLDAYIKSTKKCNNSMEANKLSELLPIIAKLSDQQARDLISAFNENDKLRCSHGFIGDKPSTYGNGLVSHLNRLTYRKYELTYSGKIEEKSNILGVDYW